MGKYSTLPSLTWTIMQSPFLEKYVLRTLTGHKKEVFMYLEQGGMLVIAYEAKSMLYLDMLRTRLLLRTRGSTILLES